MLITTTDIIEGTEIKEYKGLVSSQAVFETKIFDEYSANPKNIVNGRLNMYEDNIESIRNIAIQDLETKAEDLGANTIIGFKVDFETVANISIVIIHLTGTAVVT